MRRWMVWVLLVSLAVCARGSGTGPVVPAPPATASPLSPQDEAAVRELAQTYWRAYNAYDADAALACLEPSYRASRDATIRDEVGQIKFFGVKFGISEKSVPVALGPDRAEIYVNLSEPLGTRLIRMDFVRTSDGWLISFAEEVP
jgi:hypothetical protein